MTKSLYFNTVNKDKRAEIKEIFSSVSPEIKFLENNILEVLSQDIEVVIKAKAAEAYKKCRVPIIVEHGALLIDYLNGFPGALSKPMWDLMAEKICNLIPPDADRGAEAISAVCYCDGKTRKIFLGKTIGKISIERRGTNGFQWDPIFIPEGTTKTYSEMEMSEKLTYSQAVKAYNDLKNALKI